MEVHKATLKDIDDLVQLRINFLMIDYAHLSDEEICLIRIQSRDYFEKHIPDNSFIGMIAKTEKGEIASAAFLSIQERPANPSFITGKTGILFNVITYPEYRRKGAAIQVISRLIEEARSREISSIDLFATESGKQLYEKLGFLIPDYTAMRLKL